MWVHHVSSGKLIGYGWDECYVIPPAVAPASAVVPATAAHLC